MNLYRRAVNLSLFTISLFVNLQALGQSNIINLEWDINPNVYPNPEYSGFQVLTPYDCKSCFLTPSGEYNTPYVSRTIDGNALDIENVRIKNVKTATSPRIRIPSLSNDFKIETKTTFHRGNKQLTFLLYPLRKSGNNTEYITSFEWDIKTNRSTELFGQNRMSKKTSNYSSVLASGDFYKLAVPKEGVYKIDQDFLSSAGLDVSMISLAKLKIYGNGGQMLPEVIAEDRYDDLEENTISVYDANENDKLDPEDYILWYAPGPTKFSYDRTSGTYIAQGHDYDVASYYFLTWQGENGARIDNVASGQGLTPDMRIEQYDHLIYHESNEENHIKSGRRWWGDKMQLVRQRNFNFGIDGILVGQQAKMRLISTARATSSSSMSIRNNGNSIELISYAGVPGDYESPFASFPRTSNISFASTSTIDITFNYNKSTTEAAAWIDYFTLMIPRELNVIDNQQVIRTNSLSPQNNVDFSISNFNSVHRIWDVTDPLDVKGQQTFESGGKTRFTRSAIDSFSPPTFVIFNPDVAPTPQYIGKVENQNLHGISNTDYLMITRNDLLDEANRLADFHRSRGLSVEVIDVTYIYNEFSSGSQDVTGIRDFIKLIYDRGLADGNPLEYVLLFGDGSYDYKDVEDNNTNVVPIYQSLESNSPTRSYCSDDYYAILDDTEGYWGIGNQPDEALDVFVGRLPASNADEAKIMVDKMYHYHSEESLGNWIQTLTFIADDEDGNRHLNPSEQMTDSIESVSPEYNIKKIWLDAFEQVSFGSGNKYPKVNEEITKMIGSQGTLIFNYVGHGGENGMANERILTRPEIINWTNYDRLSFFVTASCELAKIDNLEIESPGELMLLDPDGGAIGLLATTRLVFIGTNTDLNKKLLERNLLLSRNGQLPSVGEAYLETRNRDANESINARCFILLGDPALRLLSPPHKVVTTEVNGKPATTFNDTLKALELVTISGEIRDGSTDQLMTGYNGELFPTFYDKPSQYRTLGQDDESSPITFYEQNRIIYKGNVTVAGGKFSFQFIVPKDIAYNIGAGKLSYYSKDGLSHAGGTDTSFKIGGTADSLAADNAFDKLELYIDDESWVFGGTTSSTPDMLALLYDSNGINTIGSGIGREMEAILDKDTDQERTIIVNDFYRPDLNSYQSGRIEYPFDELEPGRHTLTLKVWDVYNNSSEAYTEFIVTEEEDIQVSNVLNYPNPFNNYTEFHFDHNKAGQNLSINVNVLSVAGRVVKSISQEIANAPAHSSSVTWDGRDDFGDLLGRGAYLYYLSVKAEDGSTYSKTEKLYILN